MNIKIGNYKIPFDEKGNLLHYPHGAIIWEENYIFDDTLRIIDKTRGRSSVTYILKSESNGIEYSMFHTDMFNLTTNAVIKNGIILGKWTFVKRGMNFGIQYIEVSDLKKRKDMELKILLKQREIAFDVLQDFCQKYGISGIGNTWDLLIKDYLRLKKIIEREMG